MKLFRKISFFGLFTVALLVRGSSGTAAAAALPLDLMAKSPFRIAVINDEIGDDAFHLMEEELDWLEMAGGMDVE